MNSDLTVFQENMQFQYISHFYTTTLQSLTGKYRGLQGNPCNEHRDPAMRTGVPCDENRFFPVGIDSQGNPCESYRVWVYIEFKVLDFLKPVKISGPKSQAIHIIRIKY